MENLSRPVAFHVGEYVKVPGSKKMGIVISNSGADTCWVRLDSGRAPQPFSEWQLRRPTFKEFLWYRNPETGGMMIGKNGAGKVFFAEAVSLAVIIAAIVELEPIEATILCAIALLPTIITYFETKAQFEGKQH